MTILHIGIMVSFGGACLFGIWKKKFSVLLANVLFGLGVGVLSVYLYFSITPPEKIGFAIIALLPVAFIIFSVLNVIVAFIGGLIGILIGRRWFKA